MSKLHYSRVYVTSFIRNIQFKFQIILNEMFYFLQNPNAEIFVISFTILARMGIVPNKGKFRYMEAIRKLVPMWTMSCSVCRVIMSCDCRILFIMLETEAKINKNGNVPLYKSCWKTWTYKDHFLFSAVGLYQRPQYND